MSPKPFSVTVHPFPSSTPFSCAYERGPSSSKNALIFVGGLTSGPHTTEALHAVYQTLSKSNLDYSLWEFRMRSSYTGFGYSSLANDVEDMSTLVKYLRGIGIERIVLMGSSTGCQDCLEYTNVTKYSSPPVDAYILQAPTSDRETAGLLMPPDFFQKSLNAAQDMIAQGKQDEAMPKEYIPPIFYSPVTAYRWHSLIAKGGDDDYFSSDLSDETLASTFGRIDKPILIMPSENDEMVPPSVDKRALFQRWINACPEGLASSYSEINPGADHTLSEEGFVRWVSERIVRFLGELEKK